ncbi:hypothetical protein [Bacteroides cellulosilyticus]|uniref:hypothetical protein n=1 Tax=Bacteroides cellulosilyticus TaxID=246787 RepID=UPI0032EB3F15
MTIEHKLFNGYANIKADLGHIPIFAIVNTEIVVVILGNKTGCLDSPTLRIAQTRDVLCLLSV